MENTSLFAEVKLSEKITEEMKSKIIGDKENNVIPILRPKYEREKWECSDRDYCCDLFEDCICCSCCNCCSSPPDDIENCAEEEPDEGFGDCFEDCCNTINEDRCNKEKCYEMNEPIKKKRSNRKRGRKY